MKRLLCVSVTMVFALTACQNMPWTQKRNAPPVEPPPSSDSATAGEPPVPEPGLQLSTDQRFSDVPLPVGVHEDLEKSFVYESSKLQIGRMVYTTKSSVNELSSFYIRECPASGWKLVSVVQAAGAELSFTKPGKKLKVAINNLGIGRGGRQLVLTLVPDED